VALGVAAAFDVAMAQEVDGSGDRAEGSGGAAEGSDTPDFSGISYAPPLLAPGRTSTAVTRDEMDVRLPRSTPDALRYEPGVFVQQTSQAQASPFVRGVTGQRTVLLFDGVRLNNSTFRQGPNQYFFTVDSESIERIDVLRGSASTRWGTDAIGGVVAATPVEPRLDPSVDGFDVHGTGVFRAATADDELGARATLELQQGPRLGAIGGFGYRTVGALESGGAVYSPEDGSVPEVPRFRDDGRTQLGTGFDDYAGDGRVVYRLTEESRLTLATYAYRQRNAPRTDQCPPAFAPSNECLRYDEQDRTLALATYSGSHGRAAASLRATFSWQRQHERRSQSRPLSYTLNGGRDDVDTFGLTLQAATARLGEGETARFRVRWGADAYGDRVDSLAWIGFTDVDVLRYRSRGQYIDGSTYLWAGAFAELESTLLDAVVVRAGARVSHIAARSPGDVESGTAPVDDAWTPVVFNAGVEWWATRTTSLTFSADQGFRAPNLDDMTSRQQTGPGFQLENSALSPERSLSLELGARVRHDVVELDAWAYRTTLTDAVARSTRDVGDCPPETPGCANSWSRFQLVNLDGLATIHGLEGGVRVFGPVGLELASTVAWSIGSGPSTSAESGREPLSRIPPLNGTAELMWRHQTGIWLGTATRWAALQDRLAAQDRSDARIPRGGTPGFAVLDLRAGWRWDKGLLISLVCENLVDEAYRYHGSSVNGPGRGLSLRIGGTF
jgi:iron complex outermembrane receptor protein/hemoglobin/transferrin/lactoferrin receptor protein